MREIKFRFWSRNSKVMSEPFTIDEMFLYTAGRPDIPMQYTGLKDKNGKEIYEGDILKIIEGYSSFLEIPHIVEYSESECCYKLSRITYRDTKVILNRQQVDKLEVIGNIYENPELLIN